MNAQEIIADLVNERGALLEIWSQEPGVRSQEAGSLTLLGAAELLDEHRLFFVACHPEPVEGSLTGHILEFTTYKRLHALAVGFYDAEGELIARIAQIRECELDAPIVAQHQAAFTAWQKLLQDETTGPALQAKLDSARSAFLSPVS